MYCALAITIPPPLSASPLTVQQLDECRFVRKSAVQLLSGAAHNKPALIVDQLPGALPHLFVQVCLGLAGQCAKKHACLSLVRHVLDST